MRALVFSDSHGDVRGMEKAINTVNGVDAIIHLGDIERDVRWLEKNYGQYPLYAVLGNNDFYGGRPTEAVIELEGARIFLCHGHTRRGPDCGGEGKGLLGGPVRPHPRARGHQRRGRAHLQPRQLLPTPVRRPHLRGSRNNGREVRLGDSGLDIIGGKKCL